MDNRPQISGATSERGGASSHKEQARGSASFVRSTPTSGSHCRRRRRQTAANRRVQLGVRVPKDLNYLVSQFQFDWRSRLPATWSRTSRPRRLLLKAPPIGANCLQHHKNPDSDSTARNLNNEGIRSSAHPAIPQHHILRLQLERSASTTSSGVSSILQTDNNVIRTAPRTDRSLDLPTTIHNSTETQKGRFHFQLES